MAARRDGTISVFGDTSMGLANVPAGLLVPALPGSITIPVHPGVNAVAFEVTAPGGSESLVYSVTTRASFLPVYTSWAAAAFPVGTPATALAAGADPDGDAIPNGIEFLTGSSPVVPGPGPLTVRSDAGELVVSFSRASTIPDGLETVEVSVTPGLSWTPVPAASILRTDNGAGLPQTVIVRLPRTSERMFVRLKVVF